MQGGFNFQVHGPRDLYTRSSTLSNARLEEVQKQVADGDREVTLSLCEKFCDFLGIGNDKAALKAAFKFFEAVNSLNKLRGDYQLYGINSGNGDNFRNKAFALLEATKELEKLSAGLSAVRIHITENCSDAGNGKPGELIVDIGAESRGEQFHCKVDTDKGIFELESNFKFSEKT